MILGLKETPENIVRLKSQGLIYDSACGIMELTAKGINMQRLQQMNKDWEESKHPRSDNGQFGEGGSGGSSKEPSSGNEKSETKSGSKSKTDKPRREKYSKGHEPFKPVSHWVHMGENIDNKKDAKKYMEELADHVDKRNEADKAFSEEEEEELNEVLITLETEFDLNFSDYSTM